MAKCNFRYGAATLRGIHQVFRALLEPAVMNMPGKSLVALVEKMVKISR